MTVKGLVAIKENRLQAPSHMSAPGMGFQSHPTLLQVEHLFLVIVELDLTAHALQTLHESGRARIVSVAGRIIGEAILEWHL